MLGTNRLGQRRWPDIHDSVTCCCDFVTKDPQWQFHYVERIHAPLHMPTAKNISHGQQRRVTINLAETNAPLHTIKWRVGASGAGIARSRAEEIIRRVTRQKVTGFRQASFLIITTNCHLQPGWLQCDMHTPRRGHSGCNVARGVQMQANDARVENPDCPSSQVVGRCFSSCVFHCLEGKNQDVVRQAVADSAAVFGSSAD